MERPLESFPPEVIQQLRWYVYRLIDPRNGETFYIGKGNELTAGQITGELDLLSSRLATSPLGDQITKKIYKNFESLSAPRNIGETVTAFIRLVSLRRRIRLYVQANTKLERRILLMLAKS